MTEEPSCAAAEEMIPLGRISGLYGVRGWVRVYSYTDPRHNILNYSPWYLRRQGQWQPRAVVEGRAHGKGIVARLADCADRDAAADLLDMEIAIRRDQLPEPAPGDYYWTDLIGLEVINAEGEVLGRVDHLLETGANDVLVVQGDRERLIPYLWGSVVSRVDLAEGRLYVDWDPDF